MKTKHFLYLEILDPEINTLLSDITEVISGITVSQAAHLTIRGPYSDEIPSEVIEKARGIMRHDVLRLGDIGMFRDPEVVIYLRVDSPRLREIWWKPDFQISEHGFTPHISLYRGNNEAYAETVAAFLEQENIELLCDRFRLVPHIPRQLELIPREYPKKERYLGLLQSGRVHHSFMMRLESLVRGYRRSKGLAL